MGFFSRGSSGAFDEHARTSFSKDIENFQKDLIKSDNLEKEYQKFAKLVNNVFSRGIGIHYRFTYEDLKLEAKEKGLPSEVSTRVESLCDILNEMEFDKQKISKERIMDASNVLTELLDALVGASSGEAAIKPVRKLVSKEAKAEQDIEKLYRQIDIPAPPKAQQNNSIFSKFFGKHEEQVPDKLPDELPIFKTPKLVQEDEVIEVKLPEAVPVKNSPVETVHIKADATEGFSVGKKTQPPKAEKPVKQKIAKTPVEKPVQTTQDVPVTLPEPAKITEPVAKPVKHVAMPPLIKKPAEPLGITAPPMIEKPVVQAAKLVVKKVADIAKKTESLAESNPLLPVQKPADIVPKPALKVAKPVVQAAKPVVKKVAEIAKKAEPSIINKTVPTTPKPADKVAKPVLKVAKPVVQATKPVVKKVAGIAKKAAVKKPEITRKHAVKPVKKLATPVKAAKTIAKPKVSVKIPAKTIHKHLAIPVKQKIKLAPDTIQITADRLTVEKHGSLESVQKTTTIKPHEKRIVAELKENEEIKHKEAASRHVETHVHHERKVEKEELPVFQIPKSLIRKEEAFQKNLGDIVRSLEQGKRDIRAEVGILDQEKKVLVKEREQIRERASERKELPAFKVFDRNISKEIELIETKKNELIEKEKNIDERLKQVSVMEKNLKELSEKLKHDSHEMKQRERFLESREKIIKRIKVELSHKYNHAMKEIESLRKELDEKKETFTKLKDFYNQRENRLSVEESNLFEEKRRYAKIVSKLIEKHLALVKADFEKTSTKVDVLKERAAKADEKIKGYAAKFAGLEEEKEKLSKEMESKRKYFDSLEKDFRKKDPEFMEASEELEKRSQRAVARYAEIERLDKKLSTVDEDMKARKRMLELKELDLMKAEKDIERVNFDMQNKTIKNTMREKELNSRIESYTALRKTISASIAREKKAIEKIAEKLQSKGISVDRRLSKLNIEENGLDEYDHNIRKMAGSLKDNEELHIHEVTVTHGYPTPGNPGILDILRLLNIGYDFLENGNHERAKDAYLEIQRIFEDLDEQDREEVYPEIMKIFKTKSGFQGINAPSHVHHTISTEGNIDSLLSQFQSSVESGDMNASEEIYSRIQQRYSGMSREEKTRYYPRIMELYNRVLERQVGAYV